MLHDGMVWTGMGYDKVGVHYLKIEKSLSHGGRFMVLWL